MGIFSVAHHLHLPSVLLLYHEAPFNSIAGTANKKAALPVQCTQKAAFSVLIPKRSRLFRQVLFVLQAVPDVLDCCTLNPYEPLSIVLFQYTTHQILSQVRYYFKSALSVSACFISIIRGLSSKRPSHLFRSKRLCPLLFPCRMSLSQSKMLFHPHLYFLPIKPPF